MFCVLVFSRGGLPATRFAVACNRTSQGELSDVIHLVDRAAVNEVLIADRD